MQRYVIPPYVTRFPTAYATFGAQAAAPPGLGVGVAAVGVGVAPPVTPSVSTFGPLGSSGARIRTEPAGRLTLCVRTVQVVQPVTGNDRLDTTVVPFTWIDIGRSPVPPLP